MDLEADFDIKTKKGDKAATRNKLRSMMGGQSKSSKTAVKTFVQQSSEPGSPETITQISLDQVQDNPFQPRLDYDEDAIIELAASIKVEGLIQPVSVTPSKEGGYIVISGHRRVKAHRHLRKKTISAIVKYDVNEQGLRIRSLVENIQREEMHNIDIAFSLKASLESGDVESQSELSDLIGKDKHYVSKMLKILTLPEAIIEDLLTNKSTNDRVALDMIRRIADPIVCEEIYHWFIEERPSRAGLKKRIEEKMKPITVVPTKTFSINTSKEGTEVTLPRLSRKEKKRLEEFLNQLLDL